MQRLKQTVLGELRGARPPSCVGARKLLLALDIMHNLVRTQLWVVLCSLAPAPPSRFGDHEVVDDEFNIIRDGMVRKKSRRRSDQLDRDYAVVA